MRFLIAAAALASVLGFTGTAHAQSSIEGRVDRLEREMRAVQRKVFPGGAGATVEPQIRPEQAPVDIPGVPASSPVADLTQRVSAMESQLQSLTGQTEQNQNRIRQLEDAFADYRRSTDARIRALESSATAAPAQGGGDGMSGGGTSAGGGNVAAPSVPAPARPTGARAEQLAAIQKPNGSDPAENGYLYGYRLWEAKFYPEARKELEAVATTYPNHRRASYAQNLLGRAYLDAGAPSLAAKTFFDNYSKNPKGERAPDSLFYLAQALEKLNKPSAEICRVYGELEKSYGSSVSAEIKSGVAAGRTRHKCK